MLGRLLKNIRAGNDKLICYSREVALAPDTIHVSSEAFLHGGEIPVRFTQSSMDLFPPLSWSNLPSATRSLVLVIEDPDAPLPFAFVHAIAYNLPPETFLPEAAIPNTPPAQSQPIPDGFRIGKNTVGTMAYRGPGPIPDHGPHSYYFQLFALDANLTFNSPPRRRDVLAAMSGHVLAKGTLVGTYERKSRQVTS
jgi:Raf kinase inhibitor-like YbhB/YbcL family protein